MSSYFLGNKSWFCNFGKWIAVLHLVGNITVLSFIQNRIFRTADKLEKTNKNQTTPPKPPKKPPLVLSI